MKSMYIITLLAGFSSSLASAETYPDLNGCYRCFNNNCSNSKGRWSFDCKGVSLLFVDFPGLIWQGINCSCFLVEHEEYFVLLGCVYDE